jgi:hypothetical protein
MSWIMTCLTVCAPIRPTTDSGSGWPCRAAEMSPVVRSSVTANSVTSSTLNCLRRPEAMACSMSV